MTRIFHSEADLLAARGEEIGRSDWITITQDQINLFAAATLDHQWIHVDENRAAEGPYGAPIAHGFLTLSLLPHLTAQISRIDGATMKINYGLNKVRFPAPVPAGSRVRARSRLLKVEPAGSHLQIVSEVVIDIEGATKPACVAESVSRVVLGAPSPQ